MILSSFADVTIGTAAALAAIGVLAFVKYVQAKSRSNTDDLLARLDQIADKAVTHAETKAREVEAHAAAELEAAKNKAEAAIAQAKAGAIAGAVSDLVAIHA